jgi:hypothetical protein
MVGRRDGSPPQNFFGSAAVLLGVDAGQGRSRLGINKRPSLQVA